ncbi:YcaO-like family protein [Rhodococcus sp. A14]|uniref:YcaO-like family protein n=1 Tax=Rhodococcus sp. A14 TaxID=1194106 RepID=UPI001420CDFC|nr:hypothetical protein [Rhodococcus sp. A14]
MTISLGTSFRHRPADRSLAAARSLFELYGIRRLVDLTRLDRVGVPVFAAVRPQGRTLAVHAGKGVTYDEAAASAAMEAIEFAVAERRPPDTIPMSATEADYDVLSFCPRLGVEIGRDETLPSIVATSVADGSPHPVPLSSVFLGDGVTQRYFGSNTTGLASGNDVAEATLHGLFEVIERDTKSFQAVNDTTRLVSPESLPTHLQATGDAIEAAGLQYSLRYVVGPVPVPWFRAVIWDPLVDDPCLVNGGYGCHCDPSIAAMRAVLEAVQSRLVTIHGGRDDLAETYSRFEGLGTTGRRRHVGRVLRVARRGANAIDFAEIASLDATLDVDNAIVATVSAANAAGLRHVLRYVYEVPTTDLAVVRIVVPGAENFTVAEGKVGRRLLSHLRRQH